MAGRSPKVRRRRLGLELRQLRENANFTIDHVAVRLEVSDSKISRIENGQVSATPRDVRDMAALYGVTGQRMENLMQLARETREKPWWSGYSGLPIAQAAYEEEATSILMFAQAVVPGLFQTPDYARAVLREILYDLPSEEIERRVEFRMRRQARLAAEAPPKMWAILDEAILRRTIGDPMIMHHQLKSLVETAALPNVTLQLLPFSAGAHAALDGPFMVICFPEPTDRDMVCLEHRNSEHYLEKPPATAMYLSLFEHLRAAALKPDESLNLLSSRVDELGSQ
jgi:transcriptional regulator with XRE-family HTH domain